VDPRPPSSAEVKNVWSYISTPLCVFTLVTADTAPSLCLDVAAPVACFTVSLCVPAPVCGGADENDDDRQIDRSHTQPRDAGNCLRFRPASPVIGCF
jgi:hypothetical protein